MKKKLLLPVVMLFFLSFTYSQNTKEYSCYRDKFEKDTLQNVFDKINTQASYTGHIFKWKTYLEKNVSFEKIIATLPDSVYYFEDSVSLKFIVSKTGMLSNLEIVSAGTEETTKEAIRLIKLSCPNWIPGVDSGGAYRNSWHTEHFYFAVDRRTKEVKTSIRFKF